MDLDNALFAQMAGGATGEPNGFTGSLRYLAGDYGSISAMARDFGVARSTLRGWLGGRTPRNVPGGIIEQAQHRWRRAALSPDREAQMRADWSTDSLVIVGSYQYDTAAGVHRESEREVKLGEYLNDVGEDLVDAFLNGASPDDLESILIGAIADHGFYADTFSDGAWDVSEVRWI